MKRGRRIWIVTAILLGAAALFGVRTVMDDRARADAFDDIEPGMTRVEVERLMGAPDAEATSCLDTPTWLGAAVSATGCAHELRYYQNILPVFWTVGFDETGLVIAKYEYVSP